MNTSNFLAIRRRRRAAVHKTLEFELTSEQAKEITDALENGIDVTIKINT